MVIFTLSYDSGDRHLVGQDLDRDLLAFISALLRSFSKPSHPSSEKANKQEREREDCQRLGKGMERENEGEQRERSEECSEKRKAHVPIILLGVAQHSTRLLTWCHRSIVPFSLFCRRLSSCVSGILCSFVCLGSESPAAACVIAERRERRWPWPSQGHKQRHKTMALAISGTQTWTTERSSSPSILLLSGCCSCSLSSVPFLLTVFRFYVFLV